MGLFRSDSNYEARQPDRQLTQSADAVPGQLLQIVPYKDNEGIGGGARLLQDLHNVTWGGWRNNKNVSNHHAFEVWFVDGKVRFFLHVGSEAAAEKYINRIESSYSNSDVHPIAGGVGFPTIEPHDYVAGGEIALERHHFYPIRHFRAEEFEHDPYAKIISEMLSTEETRVVVQVVMRPEPTTWALNDGGGFLRRGISVDAVGESLKEGRVVGFLNPRIRKPTKKDKDAAKIVQQQRGQRAFNTNIRILTISPDPAEAQARCEGVAGMFEQEYTSITEQSFEGSPTAPARLPALVDDCQQRAWHDEQTILTIDEAVGTAHLPNAEIDTPNIAWKNTQRGARVAPDAAQDK